VSISDPHHHTDPTGPAGSGPAVLVAQAVAMVRQAGQALFAAQTDHDLIGTVELLAQLRSAAAVVEADAVLEADVRDLARTRLHYTSTGDWLTHLGGLRKGAGRHVVKRAHALTGPLTHTREAMTAGTVSPDQADIIVRSIQLLPSGESVRTRGERVLVEHAAAFDATDLARTGRHLVHVVDPDTTDRKLEAALLREERAAHHDRYLCLVPDGAGGVRLKGHGSVEDGALLKAVLLPLTRPQPPPAADAPAHQCGDGDRRQRVARVSDPREHGARLWDALVQIAQHALDTQLPPTSHTTPTRLTLTIGLQELKAGLADTTVTGVELSAATIRRLACDAEIIPVILGSHGEPLDVGRTRRPVTAPLWTALVVRDHHCAFPGCDRPPVMCHAHHIRHWLHGGETKLANLVMLCGHHHRVIHDSPWEVRLDIHDHEPEFLPPPKPGIQQHWIRHRPRRE
jgi:hypothetical protein